MLSRRSVPTSTQHASRCGQYADAGVDELFVQQIGPDQDVFFTTWAAEGPAAVRMRGSGGEISRTAGYHFLRMFFAGDIEPVIRLRAHTRWPGMA